MYRHVGRVDFLRRRRRFCGARSKNPAEAIGNKGRFLGGVFIAFGGPQGYADRLSTCGPRVVRAAGTPFAPVAMPTGRQLASDCESIANRPAGGANNVGEHLHRLRSAALWGRLATCGRLLIGPPGALRFPENVCTVCDLPPCGAVANVVNLRPIGGAFWARPAGSTHNTGEPLRRLRLAAVRHLTL